MWTVTPFSRRSLTRRTEEMTSRPNVSKISTFHSALEAMGMTWSAETGSGFWLRLSMAAMAARRFQDDIVGDRAWDDEWVHE